MSPEELLSKGGLDIKKGKSPMREIPIERKQYDQKS
jgi:hypothetical protein